MIESDTTKENTSGKRGCNMYSILFLVVLIALIILIVIKRQNKKLVFILTVIIILLLIAGAMFISDVVQNFAP